MTTLKLLLPFAGAITLFAESSPDPMREWEKLTALGIVALVLIYIVTKMLPSLHEKFVAQSLAFAEAMTKAESKFAETVDKIAVRSHEDAIEHAKALVDLREHCAEVRGALKKEANP